MSLLLALVGPTASGKSSLALALAQRLNGEIVSCDSMQIYTGMDIGTAKASAAERALVPHHMIDICAPEQNYSCAQYAVDAARAVEDVLSRGRLPIVCGGTGLYLDSLLCGERFAPDVSPQIEQQVAAMSIEQAWTALAEGDPEAAQTIHPHNEKRVRRALAILLGTGTKKSTWDERSRALPPAYRACVIGLMCADRARLYDRIDRRVDAMMEQGLLEEVRRLNLPRASTAAQAIGYKELYRHLDGEMSLPEAVALLKKNTRAYAKRQLTWFRRREETIWLDPSALSPEALTEAALLAFSRAQNEDSVWT